MATLRIGELLIQAGLITASQLQSALTAQRIFGGRLGTNLVEHGFVSEVDLARVLAGQLGIAMVDPGALADIDPRLIALVPPEVAKRFSVVPFAADAVRDRVCLAMADPTNLQKVDEIQFALGKRVDFFASPEIMLAFALEKYYGVERQRRYVRLAGVSEAEMHLAAEDRPARRPAGQAARTREDSRADMLSSIVRAASKKELLVATTDLLSGHCGQLVFFVVRGEELLAWDVRGVPASAEALRAAAVRACESPLLSAVLEECQERHVAKLDDPELRRVLEQVLAVDCAGGAFVLPLIVNRKGFGAAVMTQMDDGFAARIPLLVEIMKRVGYKLQMFFLNEMLTAPL